MLLDTEKSSVPIYEDREDMDYVGPVTGLPPLDANRNRCYGFEVEFEEPNMVQGYLDYFYPTFEELAVDPTSRKVLLDFLHSEPSNFDDLMNRKGDDDICYSRSMTIGAKTGFKSDRSKIKEIQVPVTEQEE